MNSHASMNRIYRLVWSQVNRAWVPVAETAKGRGKSGRARSTSIASRNVLATAISLALGSVAHASPPTATCVSPTCGTSALSVASLPLGAQVLSGSARITQSGSTTDIRQSSPDVSIDWLSFNVGSQATVDFIQPSASSVAVNRISGSNGSEILGHLDANGQVYLINPNGVVFGQGAQVNVGGLVASTLNVIDSASSAGTQNFAGNGTGSVVNQGTITAANGGYVALIGNRVSNQGVITAQLGTVALGAGSAVTLDFSGNRLVHLQVDQSTLNNLAANNQLIQADGGLVIMTAGAKEALLASVVNNTGVIEARTVQSHDGTIELLGGMTAGTVNVGGTLDASAPEGGNGGFIETSAAHVEVAEDAKVTTAASRGLTGSWLIDPNDFTVAPSGGDITGADLSSDLVTTSITLQSSQGATGGTGSVNIDDTVSWSANTLTLIAANNVNINAVMTATGSASLALNPSTANGPNSAVAGGTVVMGLTGSGFIGMVNFSGTGKLSINGTPYTVINSLGVAGSTTGTDLQGMNGNLSGDYVLGSNIDAAATYSWNGSAGFAPIGTSATPFTGIFDGLGHTVSNLYINRSTANNVGLFGYGSATSLIRNVGLIGGAVTGGNNVGELLGNGYGTTINNTYATGNVTGSSDVGGLVGQMNGCFMFCPGSVTNINATVSNSYATGSVNGTSSVGGLVGASIYGGVSNSYATGTVFGSSRVGGVMGASYYGGIFNSHAAGKVIGSSGVGGLLGANYASDVEGSFATGSVTGSSSSNNVGGLVGLMGAAEYGALINSSYATGAVKGGSYVGGLVGANSQGDSITSSYSTGRVSGSSSVGGLMGYDGGGVSNSYWNTTTSGQSTSAGGTGLTTAQMRTASNFTGFTFTTTPGASLDWVIVDTDGTLNNAGGATGATLPMLASAYSTTINFAVQLQLMAMNPAANYILGQNIDAASTGSGASLWASTGFAPIGNSSNPFSGTFDGMGHTISGLFINLPTQNGVGLFGYAGASSVLENVGMLGGNVSGYSAVGALVGSAKGTVSNAYATGSVSGNSAVGGLVGYLGGTLTNSYATSTVTGTFTTGITSSSDIGGLLGSNYGTVTSSYATGNVSGYANVGGLVGHDITGTVNNSYATASVSGMYQLGGLVGNNYGTISNSYARGSVTGSNGSEYVGGLVGYNADPINDSYAAGTVSGSSKVGGLVGYVTGGSAISNSFWDVTTSGQAASAGGIGMTTANMQQQDNFTSATAANGNVNPNWDFTNTWVMYNGFTYPMLRSFMIPLETWIGPKSGPWSNASNWSLGIVPDDANVLAVMIPTGDTVTYNSAMASLGPTLLTTLAGSAGNFNLVMDAGVLDVTGSLSIGGYTQKGGALDVGGQLTIASTVGTVTLGNIDAGTLSVTSNGGAIKELASTAVDVTGTSVLIAENGATHYGITLDNAGNSFTGSVTADGSSITLDDATALTASVDSSGPVSLTAAGAMNVSGTVGTSLTTVTSGGTGSTTTFGDTTVGTKLAVTSTGTVATAAADTLTVDKLGTSTPNKHVTVNGVNDVAIPVL
jgi:trimeric autotransporter adhesin